MFPLVGRSFPRQTAFLVARTFPHHPRRPSGRIYRHPRSPHHPRRPAPNLAALTSLSHPHSLSSLVLPLITLADPRRPRLPSSLARPVVALASQSLALPLVISVSIRSSPLPISPSPEGEEQRWSPPPPQSNSVLNPSLLPTILPQAFSLESAPVPPSSSLFPRIPCPASPHLLPCFPPSPALFPPIPFPASPHPLPCLPPSRSLLPPIPFSASPHPLPCLPPSPSLPPPIPFPASPHPLPCLRYFHLTACPPYRLPPAVHAFHPTSPKPRLFLYVPNPSRSSTHSNLSPFPPPLFPLFLAAGHRSTASSRSSTGSALRRAGGAVRQPPLETAFSLPCCPIPSADLRPMRPCPLCCRRPCMYGGIGSRSAWQPALCRQGVEGGSWGKGKGVGCAAWSVRSGVGGRHKGKHRVKAGRGRDKNMEIGSASRMPRSVDAGGGRQADRNAGGSARQGMCGGARLVCAAVGRGSA
ncbi:unnamed protein product [Closterium sp. Naga37s-1]|nr:unnamed protein product [Closterium sp. Naga37s-1]